MANPAPFVRWVGGSQKSLPALLARLPAGVAERRYVDPFVGGGALFWALRPRRALLSDACAPLMAAWGALVDVEALIRELGVLVALRETTDHLTWYRLVTSLLDAEGTHAERGAHVLSTNNPTRFAREVFQARGFTVEVEAVNRSVSRDAATRGDVLELYARRAL